MNPITDNFLDRSFQNILLPFRCLQHMLFLSRFSIEYNCIRPHRVSYYIVSLIGTLGFMIYHGVTFLSSTVYDDISSLYIFIFLNLNIVMIVIPFSIFYTLNIFQRKDNVLLIWKIQVAFRIINYKHYKKSIIRNWFAIFYHCIFFIICASVTCNFKMAAYVYTFMYFDMHLTYGASILALIREGMISWISEVEYYSKLNLELEEDKYNDELKKLYQAYINLMEAFDIFKNVFKFSALFYPLDIFFYTLLYLQASIELLKLEEVYFGEVNFKTSVIGAVFWLINNITYVNIFSTNCELFYMTLSDVNAACSRLLSILQRTVEAKRLCKNVQRLNRAAFHKMTACRMFTIDGRLPQKFNSLIVEYTVVILQFAVVSWMTGIQ